MAGIGRRCGRAANGSVPSDEAGRGGAGREVGARLLGAEEGCGPACGGPRLPADVLHAQPPIERLCGPGRRHPPFPQPLPRAEGLPFAVTPGAWGARRLWALSRHQPAAWRGALGRAGEAYLRPPRC